MRVIQISDSQLSIWYACQRRYQFEKLDRYRLIGGKQSYLVEGSLVHKMMETFYRLGIPAEGYVVPSLSDRIEAAYNEATKMMSLDPTMDVSGERFQFLKDSFVQYVDYTKDDGWIPQGVEEYFTVELYREEDTEEKEGIQVLYEGIVDLRVKILGKGDKIYPVDHKTSSSFRRIRHASILSGQFIGYMAGLDADEMIENKFGLQTSYGPPQRFIRHVITFDMQVIEEWKGWTVVQALKMDQAMQSGYFEPNFSHCFKCPYTSACFTRQSLREWKLTKDFVKMPPSNKKVYKAYAYDAE